MLENGYTLSADGRQYKIIEQLGRGANTVAYLAECSHGELVTKCILKEYSPHNTDDSSAPCHSGNGAELALVCGRCDRHGLPQEDDRHLCGNGK